MRQPWVRAMIGRVCYKTTSANCQINLEENSKRTSGILLSPLGAQNNNLGATSLDYEYSPIFPQEQ